MDLNTFSASVRSIRSILVATLTEAGLDPYGGRLDVTLTHSGTSSATLTLAMEVRGETSPSELVQQVLQAQLATAFQPPKPPSFFVHQQSAHSWKLHTRFNVGSADPVSEPGATLPAPAMDTARASPGEASLLAASTEPANDPALAGRPCVAPKMDAACASPVEPPPLAAFTGSAHDPALADRLRAASASAAAANAEAQQDTATLDVLRLLIDAWTMNSRVVGLSPTLAARLRPADLKRVNALIETIEDLRANNRYIGQLTNALSSEGPIPASVRRKVLAGENCIHAAIRLLAEFGVQDWIRGRDIPVDRSG